MAMQFNACDHVLFYRYYLKMLEHGRSHFQSQLKTGQLLEKSETEDAEISFEALLAQEKKDSFW